MLNAVLVGAAVGATTAGALTSVYLLGGMAQDAVTHARVSKLADAAATGFSQDTLRDMARTDPGALAVALRYDPHLMTGYAQRERQVTDQATELAARLEERVADEGRRADHAALFMRASLTADYNPAARPYLSGALDQSRQLDCLSQAVYYEARGETPAGQAAVAQVVLNRVRHPAFPKSVCAVVFQGAQAGRGCQFSFACDGSTRRSREPAAWRRAEKVAARALDGYVMADVGNSTHFHVTNVSPGWGPRLLRVSQIGMHVFYRFGGRTGAPNAFTAEPRDDRPEAILASMTIAPDDKASPVAGVTSALVSTITKVEAPVAAHAATPKPDAALKPEPVAAIHSATPAV